MKKALIIIFAIIVIAAIAIGVVFFMGQQGAPSGGTGTGTIPSGTTTPTGAYSSSTTGTGALGTSSSQGSGSSTITIGTDRGTVTVNNFYNTASYTTQDGQTVVLQDQADYQIVYNVSDSSFIISILATPLEANRQAAESAFLSQLGISQADACKLKVSEGVPIGVSNQYPGVNFPLSFCGNSTPM